MKLFSFALSLTVFFISLYFFSAKITHVDSLNDVIYISLLAILMTICIVGVLINWDYLFKKKKGRVILFVANSFSKKNNSK